MLKEDFIDYIESLGFKEYVPKFFISSDQAFSVKFNKNQDTCSIYRTNLVPIHVSEYLTTVTLREKCDYKIARQILEQFLKTEDEPITKEELIQYLKGIGFIKTGDDYFEYELDEIKNWQLTISIFESSCVISKIEDRPTIYNDKLVSKEVNVIIGYFLFNETKKLIELLIKGNNHYGK